MQLAYSRWLRIRAEITALSLLWKVLLNLCILLQYTQGIDRLIYRNLIFSTYECGLYLFASLPSQSSMQRICDHLQLGSVVRLFGCSPLWFSASSIITVLLTSPDENYNSRNPKVLWTLRIKTVRCYMRLWCDTLTNALQDKEKYIRSSCVCAGPV